MVGPSEVKGSGQGRGIARLLHEYHDSILDFMRMKPYPDGLREPSTNKRLMVNAMRPPGQWNVYDIFSESSFFRRRFVDFASNYAVHNGVHFNHFELLETHHRPPMYQAHASEGPIPTADHGNPVRFRNIWVHVLSPSRASDHEILHSSQDEEIPLRI